MPCRRSVGIATILGLTLATFLAAGARAAAAEPGKEWHQWRGPHFNGSSDARNIPEKFDDKTDILWTTAMPGVGSGTPVVAGDRVFVSALDNASKKLLAMCLSRQDGRILWSKEVGDGFVKNERNNMASPSPVTDGKLAWFYYGSGDLVAFDLDGNQKWARNIAKEYGPFNFQWIYGSSPLLYDGRLYVQVYHRDHPVQQRGEPKTHAPSYLLAIDPATGKNIWRHERPNEAIEESKESYGTPVPFELGGKKLLLSVGGDIVTANDAVTGEEIWRCGGWNLPPKRGDWRVVSSVVVAGGLVIACPPKGGAIFAIKPDGTGDVTSSHVAWKNPQISSDVCVPLFYQDKLYVLNGDGAKTLYRVDPATGKVETSLRLGGSDVYRASPTAADGKIFCMNEAGEVSVIRDTGEKLERVHQVDLGAGASAASRSSIALADGRVFVRTAEKLYCFGSN